MERSAAAQENEKKLEESRTEFEQQMLTTKQEKDIEILKAKDAAMQAEHKLADLSEFMAKKVHELSMNIYVYVCVCVYAYFAVVL